MRGSRRKADRIFSAFFTIKSQSTGLELSIRRTIVQSHGGRWWTTANPGRGAAFSVHVAARGGRVFTQH